MQVTITIITTTGHNHDHQSRSHHLVMPPFPRPVQLLPEALILRPQRLSPGAHRPFRTVTAGSGSVSDQSPHISLPRAECRHTCRKPQPRPTFVHNGRKETPHRRTPDQNLQISKFQESHAITCACSCSRSTVACSELASDVSSRTCPVSHTSRVSFRVIGDSVFSHDDDDDDDHHHHRHKPPAAP
jgi:hypothetical protein